MSERLENLCPDSPKIVKALNSFWFFRFLARNKSCLWRNRGLFSKCFSSPSILHWEKYNLSEHPKNLCSNFPKTNVTPNSLWFSDFNFIMDLNYGAIMDFLAFSSPSILGGEDNSSKCFEQMSVVKRLLQYWEFTF